MKKLATLLALVIVTASFSQIGIGTTTPDASATLDVTSTNKGFLPPRMTTSQRDDINFPAEGLIIYNTDRNCLQWYNGSGWYDACDDGMIGIPEGPAICENKVISTTPCSTLSGATLNDDASTVDGTEYDWTGAPSSGMDFNSSTRALVEINGQCWMRYNMANTPPNYNPSPTYSNTDEGWNDYYLNGPYANEGKLYQWSATMNGSNGERSQGLCPTGWHIPSDCEWMYLESKLGMDNIDLVEESTWTNSTRLSGDLETKLWEGGSNASGFSALLAGFRQNGNFDGRGSGTGFWTSTEVNSDEAYRRYLIGGTPRLARTAVNKGVSISVRCLRD
jgi:uncharacterized protein (TIGR02145 family)